MANTEIVHNDMICRVATKSAILDFQNALIPSLQEDYAQLQGIGGAKHAPNSGIKLGLTDYSVEGNTKYATGNVPSHIFEMAKHIVLENIGTETLAGELPENVSQINGKITQALSALVRLLTAGAKISKKISSGEQDAAEAATSSLLKISQGFTAVTGSPKFSVRRAKDWTYTQTRVNTYAMDGEYAPTSTIQIYRQNYRPAYNGKPEEEAKLPWHVRITNFKAIPADTGVGYKKGSEKEQTDVQIAFSDEDMFRICYKIEHFVNLWEQTECAYTLSCGVKISDDLRKQRKNNTN